MIKTRLLTKFEFAATYSAKMENITGREDSSSPSGVLDIWKYREAIPDVDLNGHSAANGVVELVYRCSDERYDHVLIPTEDKNAFFGHRRKPGC